MFRISEIVDLLERDWCYLRSARGLSGQLHAYAAKRCLQESTGVKKSYMITAPLAKMLEIMRSTYTASATEKIGLLTESGNEIVVIGDDRYPLGKGALRKYLWLDKLADLEGDRPKIAIPIRALADSMEERTRVEATLDWLDKWS